MSNIILRMFSKLVNCLSIHLHSRFGMRVGLLLFWSTQFSSGRNWTWGRRQKLRRHRGRRRVGRRRWTAGGHGHGLLACRRLGQSGGHRHCRLLLACRRRRGVPLPQWGLLLQDPLQVCVTRGLLELLAVHSVAKCVDHSYLARVGERRKKEKKYQKLV